MASSGEVESTIPYTKFGRLQLSHHCTCLPTTASGSLIRTRERPLRVDTRRPHFRTAVVRIILRLKDSLQLRPRAGSNRQNLAPTAVRYLAARLGVRHAAI